MESALFYYLYIPLSNNLLLLTNKLYEIMDIIILMGIESTIEKMEAKKDILGLIMFLQLRKDSHVQCLAATSLGRIGDETAVEPLIKALKDDDFVEKDCAALALGRLGDKRAVLPLIQIFNNEKEGGYIRECAAWAIGKIGDEKSVEPLIKALNDESFHLRADAAEALGMIGGLRAIKPLIKVLKNEEEHITVRRNASRALGRIGDKKARQPLIQILKNESKESQYSGLQRCIKWALAKIEDLNEL